MSRYSDYDIAALDASVLPVGAQPRLPAGAGSAVDYQARQIFARLYLPTDPALRVNASLFQAADRHPGISNASRDVWRQVARLAFIRLEGREPTERELTSAAFAK